jgi:regulatory factor X
MSQTTQVLSQSRPGTAEPVRSRSATAASRGSRRARSRGSTASIHSNTTQQTQDQHMGEGFSPFLNAQSGPDNQVFGQNPEEMIMRFGQHISHHANGASLDPSMHDGHNGMMSRQDSFQGHSMHGQAMGHGSIPPEMVPHGLTGMPVPHYASFHDGPLDASLPERMMDENENSEAGARKKRGSSSTVANDNELRKLLRQYEGYSLKQMAMEVQKHEGAGGKSEKVKQVFAMVW